MLKFCSDGRTTNFDLFELDRGLRIEIAGLHFDGQALLKNETELRLTDWTDLITSSSDDLEASYFVDICVLASLLLNHQKLSTLHFPKTKRERELA